MKRKQKKKKKMQDSNLSKAIYIYYIYIPFRMVSTNKTGAGTGYLLAARSAHIGGTILARAGRKS